jgi:biotin operon repressor
MKPDPDQSGAPRLSLDPDEFGRRQRLALYQIVNVLVNLASDVQKTLKLRPDACQIYMIIAVSAVQKYAREPSGGAHDGVDPLPLQMSGSVSRRRIAEITGIPRETVARHVRHLIERGLVVEVGSGKLVTPPGLLRDIGPTGLPDRLVAEFTKVAQRLAGLGVVRIETRAVGIHET